MKHTIKGYIVHETWNGDREGKYVFQESKAHRSSQSYTQIDVCEHSTTFDIPEGFDPRPEQIKALEKKKEEARAAYVAMVKELDDRINSLLALEMSA